MIVTASRNAAVTYKEMLDELDAPPSAVIVSGDHNDPVSGGVKLSKRSGLKMSVQQ